MMLIHVSVTVVPSCLCQGGDVPACIHHHLLIPTYLKKLDHLKMQKHPTLLCNLWLWLHICWTAAGSQNNRGMGSLWMLFKIIFCYIMQAFLVTDKARWLLCNILQVGCICSQRGEGKMPSPSFTLDAQLRFHDKWLKIDLQVCHLRIPNSCCFPSSLTLQIIFLLIHTVFSLIMAPFDLRTFESCTSWHSEFLLFSNSSVKETLVSITHISTTTQKAATLREQDQIYWLKHDFLSSLVFWAVSSLLMIINVT